MNKNYGILQKKLFGLDFNRELTQVVKNLQVTNDLRIDYLRALIKDIMLELYNKDKKLITQIFKKCRRYSRDYLIDVIIDRLQHSMKLKGLLTELEVTYKSSTLKQNPDLFTEDDKVYPLDRAALKQIKERMNYSELLELWDWKLSGDGIFLVLGTYLADNEKPIEYHSSNSKLKFTNELKEIKLKLEKPSQNTIYGTKKQPSNYSLERDTEYRHKEETSYNFSSGQGVGFFLLTRQVSPENKLKIDGQDVAKNYHQKKANQTKIENQSTSWREEYYGENIILRNFHQFFGKLVGDLMYLYGPEKKNKLRIKGFVNGDYGINLKRKAMPSEISKPG